MNFVAVGICLDDAAADDDDDDSLSPPPPPPTLSDEVSFEGDSAPSNSLSSLLLLRVSISKL